MAVSGYQPWVAHNYAIIKHGIELFVKEKNAQIIEALKRVADQMLVYIESNADITIPIFTGNLHDATGIGVYENGAIVYLAIPPKIATRKQSTGPSMGSRRYIDGHLFLQQSIVEGQTVFTNGIWIVLFSAVPYAAHIDTLGSPLGRGKEYFWLAQKEFEKLILSSLTPIVPIQGFRQ